MSFVNVSPLALYILKDTKVYFFFFNLFQFVLIANFDRIKANRDANRLDLTLRFLYFILNT